MWPASMLAKSRAESEMSRTNWEMTSIGATRKTIGPAHAGGHPALEVAHDALGPDALDVVRDPHHERERERHREVGRGRVEREGGDRQTEDLDRVLGVEGQRDVPDHVVEPDEEEQRGDEREPLLGHAGVHVAPGDRVAREVVGELDGGLHAVWLGLHAARDVEHDPAGGRRREHEVGDRLRDREVDAEDLDGDPRVETELVLGSELLLLGGGRRRGQGQREDGRRDGGEEPGHSATARHAATPRSTRRDTKYVV